MRDAVWGGRKPAEFYFVDMGYHDYAIFDSLQDAEASGFRVRSAIEYPELYATPTRKQLAAMLALAEARLFNKTGLANDQERRLRELEREAKALRGIQREAIRLVDGFDVVPPEFERLARVARAWRKR